MVAPIPAATFRVNAKDAAWVDRKMTPHPVKCFTETLRVSGAYLTIAEKLYIRALDYPPRASMPRSIVAERIVPGGRSR